jgi:hypothetical protein
VRLLARKHAQTTQKSVIRKKSVHTRELWVPSEQSRGGKWMPPDEKLEKSWKKAGEKR